MAMNGVRTPPPSGRSNWRLQTENNPRRADLPARARDDAEIGARAAATQPAPRAVGCRTRGAAGDAVRVKSELRDAYPFGLLQVPLEDCVRIHASSGTRGKATIVAYTRADLAAWADCCARALAAAGAGPGTVVHVAYGYGLFTGGLGLHYGAERLGCTTVPASGGNTPRQAQ